MPVALAANSVSYGGGSANIQPGCNNMIPACDTQVDGHRVRASYSHNLSAPDAPSSNARPSVIDATLSLDEAGIVLEVSDDGVGMPAARSRSPRGPTAARAREPSCRTR